MEYKASLDTLAKIITIGIFLLLVVLSYRSIKVLTVAQEDTATILIHSGILLLFVAILGGSYIYSPRNYFLTDDSLIIKRSISDINVKLSDIDEVRLIGDNDATATVRTFGVGGLFGYFGKYHNSMLGHLKMYATKRDGKVLITTKLGKKIIITPDNKGLVDDLKNKATANIQANKVGPNS